MQINWSKFELALCGSGFGKQSGKGIFLAKPHKKVCAGARRSSGFEMYQALFFMTIGCCRSESMGLLENRGGLKHFCRRKKGACQLGFHSKTKSDTVICLRDRNLGHGGRDVLVIHLSVRKKRKNSKERTSSGVAGPLPLSLSFTLSLSLSLRLCPRVLVSSKERCARATACVFSCWMWPEVEKKKKPWVGRRDFSLFPFREKILSPVWTKK